MDGIFYNKKERVIERGYTPRQINESTVLRSILVDSVKKNL